MQRNASRAFPPVTVGSLIKEARERDGISIRELARRSGISAAQISRMESGKTKRSDEGTIGALAAALGRPAGVLAFAGGHCNLLESGALPDRLQELPVVFEEFSDEQAQLIRWEFVGTTLWDSVGSFGLGDEESTHLLEELAHLWPALTDERRRRVLEHAADQVALSRLDRLAEEKESR